MIVALSKILNKIEILVLLAILSLSLIRCQQSNSKVIVAEFNVNKSLLNDSSFVTKSGFTINPPKNWIKTDSYNSELQKKVLYRLSNKLLAIYKSDTTNCALIISELQEPDFDAIKVALNKDKSSFNKDSIWTNVQSSFFKYKNYEIVQIVSQNNDLVIFKLFIHRFSELYELDYVIPRIEVNNMIQSVESSIGSVN
jgi:hypothetical protein